MTMCDVDKCLLAQLYGEFADHFKLSECKLAIIHCGGHSDPILVQSLWQEIMEKGKCQHSGAGGAMNLYTCCINFNTPHAPEVSANVWSCLELADTIAMSPVDRMRSTSLKLVSLGKIYAGTPRYFPLGKHSYSCNNLHVFTH